MIFSLLNKRFYSNFIKDRITLSKSITLIESTRKDDREKAKELISSLIPKVGEKSVRIGISGSPGVGKSCFIENFGM
jgi:LAO/AO transport system kinase